MSAVFDTQGTTPWSAPTAGPPALSVYQTRLIRPMLVPPMSTGCWSLASPSGSLPQLAVFRSLLATAEGHPLLGNRYHSWMNISSRAGLALGRHRRNSNIWKWYGSKRRRVRRVGSLKRAHLVDCVLTMVSVILVNWIENNRIGLASYLVIFYIVSVVLLPLTECVSRKGTRRLINSPCEAFFSVRMEFPSASCLFFSGGYGGWNALILDPSRVKRL